MVSLAPWRRDRHGPTFGSQLGLCTLKSPLILKQLERISSPDNPTPCGFAMPSIPYRAYQRSREVAARKTAASIGTANSDPSERLP